MEGTIPGNRVDQFRARLREGSVYTIEKFNLYDAKKSYRAVDHPLRICFTQRTVVNEVLTQPEGFPIFAYSAFPFIVLTGRVDQNVLMSGKFVCTFSFLICGLLSIVVRPVSYTHLTLPTNREV